MPTLHYNDLLQDARPEVIETWEQYEAVSERFGALLRKGRSRTTDETKLFKLLGLLIEDYDRKHGMPPEHVTPAAALQFLVDHSGKTANDLLAPIFGQRSHVHEALTGKRAISAAQARKLGKLFSVKPGLFV
jgi:HTH-type transcriptional regulator / antitoxin HigA